MGEILADMIITVILRNSNSGPIRMIQTISDFSFKLPFPLVYECVAQGNFLVDQIKNMQQIEFFC